MREPEVPLHGGPDALGAAPHDFSTNAHPAGTCPLVDAALRAADVLRYPDPAYTALRETLARFHGVDAARIVLAGSASEFIFRVSALVARDPSARVWLPAHGYGEYARAAAAWGLPACDTPGHARLLWMCDPASPLGTAFEGLPAWVDGLDREALCMLDLAYEPFRLQGRLSLQRLDRVWQLWTPNKALACTGVRAAYAIAPTGHEATVRQLARLAPSWLLGAQGVALLHEWTTPAVQQWLQASLATLRSWKARQLDLCASLGWPVHPGSVANFFCARPSTDDLPLALRHLRERGIKLRDAQSFGLPGWVRMAVLPPASQQALAEAVSLILPNPALTPTP